MHYVFVSIAIISHVFEYELSLTGGVANECLITCVLYFKNTESNLLDGKRKNFEADMRL